MELRKREEPVTPLCSPSELWLGRYCFYTLDSGSWFDECFAPSDSITTVSSQDPLTAHSTPLAPGASPTADWVRQLMVDLYNANLYPSRPGDDVSFQTRLAQFGRLNRRMHNCPWRHVCVQGFDADLDAHVACKEIKTAAQRWRDGGDTYLEFQGEPGDPWPWVSIILSPEGVSRPLPMVPHSPRTPDVAPAASASDGAAVSAALVGTKAVQRVQTGFITDSTAEQRFCHTDSMHTDCEAADRTANQLDKLHRCSCVR